MENKTNDNYFCTKFPVRTHIDDGTLRGLSVALFYNPLT